MSREAKFAATVQSALARTDDEREADSDARAVARAEAKLRAGGKHSLHYAVKGLVNKVFATTAVTQDL